MELKAKTYHNFVKKCPYHPITQVIVDPSNQTLSSNQYFTNKYPHENMYAENDLIIQFDDVKKCISLCFISTTVHP